MQAKRLRISADVIFAMVLSGSERYPFWVSTVATLFLKAHMWHVDRGDRWTGPGKISDGALRISLGIHGHCG